MIRDYLILTFVALLPDSIISRIDSDEFFENIASNACCAPFKTLIVDLEKVRGCAAKQDESWTLGIVGSDCFIWTKGFEVTIGQPLNHDTISGVIRTGNFRDIFTGREWKVGRNLGFTELKILTSDLNGVHLMSPRHFGQHC